MKSNYEKLCIDWDDESDRYYAEALVLKGIEQTPTVYCGIAGVWTLQAVECFEAHRVRLTACFEKHGWSEDEFDAEIVRRLEME
jgi:hypothetical protein